MEKSTHNNSCQKPYIDENALQPGQVNTYFNWEDVHHADQYLAELERLRDQNATSEEISGYLVGEFEKMGLPAASQRYLFSTASSHASGSNSYALLSSPRASGTEAVVISASWLSRTGEGNGTLNLRGVASVLSLASFLKGHSLWAKDLIFVISDGYLEGMQAWISAYHGAEQSNLFAEPLRLSSGVIWTALNIDYPGHSFSHLGVFFEGLNGRLPNQDLINSFQLISRFTGGVPVFVYDHSDSRELPVWLPGVLEHVNGINEYAYRAKNILRHVGYQARGKASGVHGLLHQFRIDAITLFAVPAAGPHGFHAFGRVMESTLRTTNNLLERLHASFFFYLLVGTETFLKIGSYLPSAIIIGIAMLFTGLNEWVTAGSIWTPEQLGEKATDAAAPSGQGQWTRRRRPVLPALAVIIATHLAGILTFFTITRPFFLSYQTASSLAMFAFAYTVPVISSRTIDTGRDEVAPLATVLKAFNLCIASVVTSGISILNFSLAAVLAVALGFPLCYSSKSSRSAARIIRYTFYSLLAFGWLFVPEQVRQAVADWELLGVWFAPFVCIVYVPLMLQGAVVTLLAQ